MGTLGTLGAIVPVTSQKKIAHGTAHFELFLKGVIIPTNMFLNLHFVQKNSCMAQRAYIC